jgi:cyclomaltodextrinase
MNYRWYRSLRHFLIVAPDSLQLSDALDSLEIYRSNTSLNNNHALMNLVSSHDTPRVLTSLFNRNPYKLNSDIESDTAYKVNKPDPHTHDLLKLLDLMWS